MKKQSKFKIICAFVLSFCLVFTQFAMPGTAFAKDKSDDFSFNSIFDATFKGKPNSDVQLNEETLTETEDETEADPEESLLLPEEMMMFMAPMSLPEAEIIDNGSRLSASVENVDTPLYQWKRADAIGGTYEPIAGASEEYYDITAADANKYIVLSIIDVEGNELAVSEPIGPIGKLVTSATLKGGTLVSGHYILNDDIKLTSTITIGTGNKVKIDLNGHVLEGSGSGSVISNSGNLTIKDSRPDEGSRWFKMITDGPWEMADSEPADKTGYREIKGGIITGGREMTKVTSSSNGGGTI